MAELGPCDIISPPARLAFPALFTPKPVSKGEAKEKYQATLLLPPDTDLKPFYKRIKAAMVEGFGGPIKLKSGKNPIKPCSDKEELDGYDEGWHYINTASKFQPKVVGPDRKEITDPERIFPGCWCHFFINAYPWIHPQSGKGVSFGLNAIQLIREDERLDGRIAAEDVFEELEVAEDPMFGEDEMDDDDLAELLGG